MRHGPRKRKHHPRVRHVANAAAWQRTTVTAPLHTRYAYNNRHCSVCGACVAQPHRSAPTPPQTRHRRLVAKCHDAPLQMARHYPLPQPHHARCRSRQRDRGNGNDNKHVHGAAQQCNWQAQRQTTAVSGVPRDGHRVVETGKRLQHVTSPTAATRRTRAHPATAPGQRHTQSLYATGCASHHSSERQHHRHGRHKQATQRRQKKTRPRPSTHCC